MELNEKPSNTNMNSDVKIRYCYKFTAKSKDKDVCVCLRKKSDHEEIGTEDETWSYDSNTKCEDCNYLGRINFLNYKNNILESRSNFIRFDVVDNLDVTVETIYKKILNDWDIFPPSLIISIYGGHKQMFNFTKHQKKNFKQGLIDVMTKGNTWIISGGFNVGINQLVTEAVQEFRCYYDDKKYKVQLLGICTWGVVKNNEKLINKNKDPNAELNYEFDENEKGKVVLDSRYDVFLFCDDGTVKQYDKEAEFEIKFQKHIEKVNKAFIVKILFEGGKRSVGSVLGYLKNSIPVVIIKDSGRASNLIVEALDMKNANTNSEQDLVKNYVESLKLLNEDTKEIADQLKQICKSYKDNIIVYDMKNLCKKFDKHILESFFVDFKDGYSKDLCTKLEISIRFNCPDMVKNQVFNNQGYYEIDKVKIHENCLQVLKRNQPEFLKMFIEADVKIEDIINQNDNLNKLYKESFSVNSHNFQISDVLGDLEKNYYSLCGRHGNINEDDKVKVAGNIIETLSGNILNNPYKKERQFVNRDLFLWALVSGHSKIAEILWENGRDQLSSALIGATMFYRTAKLLQGQGYSNKSTQLLNASNRFQMLATNILDEAYQKNKSKTYDLLVRCIDEWNGRTCIEIASNGMMLDFLNHSACKSYITYVWIGHVMSLFTPSYRILISIPCFFLIPSLMIGKSKSDNCEDTQKSRDDIDETDVLVKSNDSLPHYHSNNLLGQTIKFYSTPVVKFYLYVIFYILFLLIFSYMNLCILRPIAEVKTFHDYWPEVVVYFYIVTFIAEEIRQVMEDSKTTLFYKLKSYISESWNQIDLLVNMLALIGIVLRFTLKQSNFVFCRCIFAVCLSAFFLRIMQLFFISKRIGPKIIMIRNMLKDLVFFLAIFGVFVTAYGTFMRSLAYPNSHIKYTTLINVFYLPYFQTYGELMLDNFDEIKCQPNEWCKMRKGMIVFSFAVFLLMTNILLINLLIAMFGYTFNKIQEGSEKYYSYIRVQLVKEFYKKPFLPPPFTLIFYAFTFLCRCCCFRHPESDLLQKHLETEEYTRLTVFEQMCTDSVLAELDIKENVHPSSHGEASLYHMILEQKEMAAKSVAATEKPLSLKRWSMLSRLERTGGKLENLRSS